MGNAQADEAHRVTPRVFFWEAYEPAVKTDLSCSAVLTGAGVVFIDPIPLASDALAEMLELGPPHAIVLTNANHWRAAEQYRTRLAVPIHAHAQAVDEGRSPDELLASGQTLAGGELTVLEVAGAGPGEIALLHREGSLHVGDALVHVEPLGFAPLPEKYCTDPGRLRKSLKTWLRLEFSLLLFAHGTPLVSAHRRLAQLLA